MCELRFATLAASKRVGAVNAPARFFWQWQMHVSEPWCHHVRNVDRLIDLSQP